MLLHSDKELRAGLEYALDIINPRRKAKLRWDDVEDAVELVTLREGEIGLWMKRLLLNQQLNFLI